jgi:phosphatidylglycerophosphate synthase
LFGFIICLKASIYYTILKKEKILNIAELTKIIVFFNILGFFNEFFQNWYKHQSIWQLTFDSKKDILMNLIGSIAFVVYYQKINNKLQVQDSIRN